jgi:hypothetical protein
VKWRLQTVNNTLVSQARSKWVIQLPGAEPDSVDPDFARQLVLL